MEQIKDTNKKYEGLEVVDVCAHHDNSGFTVSWICPKIGFGNVTVSIADHKLFIETECMSDQFVSAVLSKIMPFVEVID